MHTERHPLADQKVTLNNNTLHDGRDFGPAPGKEYEIEDWWDHLTGKSWMDSEGNPAALQYAMRSSGMNEPDKSKSPIFPDDEVVYGKINSIGHLIHVSELGEVVGDTRPSADRSAAARKH